MSQQFPWWFKKLLVHYLPDYVVLVLEQPWIAWSIVGTFFTIKILLLSYAVYRLKKEQKKRKKLEIDYDLLRENYERLKLTHNQQQAALCTFISKNLEHRHEKCPPQNP